MAASPTPNRLKRLPLTLARHENQAQCLPPMTRDEAMAFLKSGWQATDDTYVFLNEGENNLFVVARVDAQGEALDIRIRVRDAFGLLGLVGKSQTLELEFGFLPLADADFLLKLFYEGNYMALRSLHRGMKVNS